MNANALEAVILNGRVTTGDPALVAMGCSGEGPRPQVRDDTTSPQLPLTL